MPITYGRLYFALALTVSVSVSAVDARTLAECMQEKMEANRDRQTVKVFTDAGCTTSGTEFIVRLDYTGWRVHECRQTLCWNAPANYIIVNSEGQGGSAAGSRHDWSGPEYRPHREQASQVCYNVYARGPDRDLNARGWQKVEASATIERVLTGDEAIVAATQCTEEIKQQ